MGQCCWIPCWLRNSSILFFLGVFSFVCLEVVWEVVALLNSVTTGRDRAVSVGVWTQDLLCGQFVSISGGSSSGFSSVGCAPTVDCFDRKGGYSLNGTKLINCIELQLITPGRADLAICSSLVPCVLRFHSFRIQAHGKRADGRTARCHGSPFDWLRDWNAQQK